MQKKQQNMQGYCEKVNTLLNDKFFFSIAEGNLQFYRDSSKSKLVDCVVLNNKTVIQDQGEKSLKLTNIFMQSGNQAPKFVLKCDDASIRNEWRSAIEAACRPTATSASKPSPQHAPHAKSPSSVKSVNSQSSHEDSQHHINSLHRMQERMDILGKQEEMLEAQRMQLNARLKELCRDGGRELPANKPKIARIMKDIKSKTDAIKTVTGMRSKLQDQVNLVEGFIRMRDANADFQIDRSVKSEMSQLIVDIEKNSDSLAELEAQQEELNALFSQEPDMDDDELTSQLEEIERSVTHSASAEDPFPALSLPAAGRKELPSAVGGGKAHAVRDERSEDELARCQFVQSFPLFFSHTAFFIAGLRHQWHKFLCIYPNQGGLSSIYSTRFKLPLLCLV